LLFTDDISVDTSYFDNHFLSCAMQSTFTPVPYEFREIIEEHISKKTSGKIFYFAEGIQVGEAQGSIVSLEDRQDGMFINLDSGYSVRIDRVITLFGKPGAAFDEYDALGRTCMECDWEQPE